LLTYIDILARCRFSKDVSNRIILEET